jgi:hypothetical protein
MTKERCRAILFEGTCGGVGPPYWGDQGTTPRVP